MEPEKVISKRILKLKLSSPVIKNCLSKCYADFCSLQVSLAIGYPTAASAPHSIANGLKNLMAIAAETDITFAAAEKLKAYLADPSAFAVAAAPAAAPPAAATTMLQRLP